MPDKEDIEQVLSTITDIERICEEHRGAPGEARKQIEELIIGLADGETDNTQWGGIRSNIANALARTYARKDLRELMPNHG